jgi:hypothetical protein
MGFRWTFAWASGGFLHELQVGFGFRWIFPWASGGFLHELQMSLLSGN